MLGGQGPPVSMIEKALVCIVRGLMVTKSQCEKLVLRKRMENGNDKTNQIVLERDAQH